MNLERQYKLYKLGVPVDNRMGDYFKYVESILMTGKTNQKSIHIEQVKNVIHVYLMYKTKRGYEKIVKCYINAKTKQFDHAHLYWYRVEDSSVWKVKKRDYISIHRPNYNPFIDHPFLVNITLPLPENKEDDFIREIYKELNKFLSYCMKTMFKENIKNL